MSEGGSGNQKLPYNIEAEKSVLAACMLNADILGEVVAKLEPDSFYRQSHRIIFEIIRDLAARNVPVDQISLAEGLAAAGRLDAVGGHSYIVELADNTFSLTSWQNHIEVVHRDAILRDLVLAGTQISALASTATDDLKSVVEEAEQTLFAVTGKSVRSSFANMGDLLTNAFEEITEIAERKGEMLGVPTGFIDVDNLFHGLRGGNLVVLAARPGVGKTSFALNIAVNAAEKGFTVVFFSLEMSSSELVMRLLSSESRVSISKMRSGNIEDWDWGPLADAANTLSQLDLLIDADDATGLSVLDARTKARRALRSAHGKGLIIIDYLQLMEPAVRRRDVTRAQEVAEMSRGLKMLAKELDVPIIALSQLSRDIEKRPDKRPLLSDLRESGAIEQDADIVMFVDRSTTPEEAEKDNRPPSGIAKLTVAKNRNGETREITLAFVSECTKFQNFADDSRAW